MGVGNDYILGINKGRNQPFFNQYVRLKLIDSFKPVDYCFLDESDEKNHPLDIVEETFKNLKPNIYIINDDAVNIQYRKRLSLKYGIKMSILKRSCPPEFDNISTSKIIKKIKGE